MTGNSGWQPRHDDPLFILAMDHRASFGKTLFEVKNDDPDPAEVTAMESAKQLIFEGLQAALPSVTYGRIGVLVDERYGQSVIHAVRGSGQPIVLAVPVEASGHDWFTLEWGDQWLEHVETVRPDYAKVLIRDNPAFDAADREAQFSRLAQVGAGLRGAGVPLLYELLVPATGAQLEAAGHDAAAYDRNIRPGLVATVIADNQAHGVEPALWKVEGLETVEAARQVAEQAKAGGRATDLIVLGRDAPAAASRPLARGGQPGQRVRRLRDRPQHLGGRRARVRGVRPGRSRGQPGPRPGRRTIPGLRRAVETVIPGPAGRLRLRLDGLRVHQVAEPGQHAGIGFRQHAVPQVEHVALGRAAALDHVPGPFLDDLPGGQQHRRIQVALQRLARFHPPDGLVKRDAPVDPDHVRAGLAHQAEQLAGTDPEVDARHARGPRAAKIRLVCGRMACR